MTLHRRLAAECIGTALLLAVVVGSGIMGERLAGGNTAIALLANSLATGGALAALILVFGPVSGAHFNPVVSLALAVGGWQSWRDVPAYIIAQCLGAIAGVWIAHLMFAEPVLQVSARLRDGPAQLFSEVVASFGLLTVIFGCIRRDAEAAWAVAVWIVAAYWFTASTSFANPAVTLARCLTDTFAGIRPQDAPGFIGAQLTGAALAALLDGWLHPRRSPAAEATTPVNTP